MVHAYRQRIWSVDIEIKLDTESTSITLKVIWWKLLFREFQSESISHIIWIITDHDYKTNLYMEFNYIIIIGLWTEMNRQHTMYTFVLFFEFK